VAPARPLGARTTGRSHLMAQVKVKVKIRKLEKIETTGQRDEFVG
jgi:hypothetical protein